MNALTVSWFSAGVSSAVATKLLINEIDRIFYTHIEDQHPDTIRFLRDCEAWFGRPVEIQQSRYMTVENAIYEIRQLCDTALPFMASQYYTHRFGAINLLAQIAEAKLSSRR